jgi:potassium efflux system protein
MLMIRDRIFAILLLPALFFVYGEGYAQDGPNLVSPPKESLEAIDDGTSSRKAETANTGKPQRTDTIPKIADIIPLATELSARAAVLENSLKTVSNLIEKQTQHEGTEEQIQELSSKLEKQKGLAVPRNQSLLEIKKAIQRESDFLQKNSAPLKEAINRLQSLREEWFVEKKKWSRWQEAVMKNGGVEKLTPVFSKVDKTIDKALSSIEAQLETMLSRQEKSAAIQSKIDNLIAEIDDLIMKASQETGLSTYPPMFSKEYFSHFGLDLLHRLESGLASVSWIEGPFFARHGWSVVVQFFITLLLIVQIYRNRIALREFERLNLLAERPLSGAIYLGIMFTILLYDSRGAPGVWRMGQGVIGGIAFALLWSNFVETPWKKHGVYTLIVVLILNRFFTLISLPLPLARLYIVLASLTGLLLCLRWIPRAAVTEESAECVLALRMGVVFLGYVALAEIWGQGDFPQYLFVSAVNSLSILIGFILFMYLIRGALEWFVRSVAAPRLDLSQDEAEPVVTYTGILINAIILGLLLCIILVNWGVFETLEAAAYGISKLGFTSGATHISVGSVIAAIGVVYFAFMLSRLARKLLINRVLTRKRIEKGVIISISGLLHYAVLLIGFLFALMVMGFDLTKITIILSALGVGIGFGMQTIANNFISGLILLVERPIRVGDYIELGGNWAEIKRIGLRATNVTTFDNADVIVPNSELVTNQVTNWTLSSRIVRVIIPVGVAYGSDIAAVVENLLACAADNPKVMGAPAPQVLFLRFGESSLDYELRVWVRDANERLAVTSELHGAIYRRFLDANIEIAFPQRDLHLRSVDESIHVPSSHCARDDEPSG